MIEIIKGLVRGNRICVLSTIAVDRPYSSLMRYSCDNECTEIYLFTHRATTKYQNLQINPWVSLLMDTREKAVLTDVQALSIEGCLITVNDQEKLDNIHRRFVLQHPDLKDFVCGSDAALLCIEIHSFLLLNGLADAHHVRIK